MAVSKKIIVKGFRAGAVHAHVRYAGRPDLGLIVADEPATAAGVFTRNRVKAPSIIISRRRIGKGRAQAVLANSGNANTCVGERGKQDVLELTRAAAGELGIAPGLVLMNSTGVIGEPLPKDRIIAAIPGLAASIRSDGFPDFARAIMTTDTRSKIATRSLSLGSGRVTIAAAAKGAGMIMPNMATMLVYILTDAAVTEKALKQMLGRAVHQSFNALTIDGDTSTSDSVIMMASGASRVRVTADARSRNRFEDALTDLCVELAKSIAADGEGATKWYTVNVSGARTEKEADTIARRVANSLLVKTAFHAADPNWGRIMMAVGSAGVALRPELVDVSFEHEAAGRVSVVENGAISGAYSEAKARMILVRPGFCVNINLRRGKRSRVIYTCDLSADYVKINAEYRT